ncbi:MAG: type III secretion system chaperone [Desulfobacter sp.]|nr:type III secretion system chaperone [Desulfobacter sp.]
MEKYQMLLDEVGKIVGIDLKLEDKGICTLQFDEIILNIHFIEEEDQCYFFSALFPIPGNETIKAALFETLLEKNCFYRETMGGILGIDTGLDKVTYAAKFSVASMDGNAFVSRMETFINATEHFVDTLGKSDHLTASPVGPNDPTKKEIHPDEFQNMIKI